MKNQSQIIKKITSAVYYIALVILILSNVKLWGQRKTILGPFWGHLSLYVVIFCILLFIGSHVIKWFRRK
ncbi:hypothetical protein A4R26_33855 [Niastella populi]|uniref:Uncharacterized protein n=1 Tax=Niastella populi TaxID=550983 RepID=A0A1V9FXN9_9BACT|nr:hypothetical protein A4R26_33855 [Niastella populi]